MVDDRTRPRDGSVPPPAEVRERDGGGAADSPRERAAGPGTAGDGREGEGQPEGEVTNSRRGEFAALFGIAFAICIFVFVASGSSADGIAIRILIVILALVLMGIGFGIWLGTQDKFWT